VPRDASVVVTGLTRSPRVTSADILADPEGPPPLDKLLTPRSRSRFSFLFHSPPFSCFCHFDFSSLVPQKPESLVPATSFSLLFFYVSVLSLGVIDGVSPFSGFLVLLTMGIIASRGVLLFTRSPWPEWFFPPVFWGSARRLGADAFDTPDGPHPKTFHMTWRFFVGLLPILLSSGGKGCCTSMGGLTFLGCFGGSPPRTALLEVMPDHPVP